MAIRVGINGFGRIGRLAFRVMRERDNFEVVAINDLSGPENLAYLLKYDSVHGRLDEEVTATENSIVVDGDEYPVLSIKDPKELPWDEEDVYFAIESTGVFRNRSSEKGGYGDHLEAGAEKVLLTVPAKDEIDATIVLGVNDEELGADDLCLSNASCTTNCLGPITKVLNDEFGIEKALMTTCHGYTNNQSTCDQIHSKMRRGRAAAVNIIPTTTGAAKAIGKVISELDGKIDGMALRVPVPCGSIVDLVASVGRETSVEEVNEAMKKAADGPMKGILEYSEDPLVSTDILDNPASSILDSEQTMVVGNLVKVLSWYDNECGYSTRVIDLMEKAAAL
ncbi:MAG: type I glyceraldehyde-3-phosphate dehydrogenase [Planctomycetes bacterium]|nr:type I glyceraldehyde-3-phosphate dehydrogenase [Planctomycetota bacterium]